MLIRKTVFGIIALQLALSASAFAQQGGNAQTSSDQKRTKKTISLRMRVGDIEMKDVDAQAGVGYVEGGTTRFDARVGTHVLINGSEDEEGSNGTLFSPSASVAVERGPDGKVKVREAEATLGSVYSMPFEFT